MIKRMIVMLALCGLVLGGVFAFKMFGLKMMKQHMAAASNPPQSVSTIKVSLEGWKTEIRAVGSLRAAKGADLSSEVQGMVENIFFESGQDVEEGTVLLQLRSADDKAKLAALEANLHLAELTVERDGKQLKAKAISQATYDGDAANLESLKAQVAEQRASLEKKTILAPFAGRLGIRQVDVGQYLSPGAAIVTLQQVDPIYLDFSVPQQVLTKVDLGQKIEARTDAYPDKAFEGEVTAVNAKVEENTRNIEVRATLRNADKALKPGMFATVSVTTGAPQQYLTLPQTAIAFNPYGSTVYIVETTGADDKGAKQPTAKMVFVQTGATRGDQIAVLSGIKEGDEVVTAGQLKLRNGSPLVINNSIQPSNDINPKPEDK
ncbi:MAG: efflux RND transporter periplasmic adaptor subunit [Alphaproteobacteria bacterium]|nr:efflux RND transporter periplasmic adaptor subunit [Alphaproteobacteria bacterium]